MRHFVAGVFPTSVFLWHQITFIDNNLSTGQSLRNFMVALIRLVEEKIKE
jgi:hypothetical protein